MSEQLFLVRGVVTRSNYMDDDNPPVTETRLVYAANADEAESKFEVFWTDQDSDYSHSYRASSVKAFEAIR